MGNILYTTREPMSKYETAGLTSHRQRYKLNLAEKKDLERVSLGIDGTTDGPAGYFLEAHRQNRFYYNLKPRGTLIKMVDDLPMWKRNQ